MFALRNPFSRLLNCTGREKGVPTSTESRDGHVYIPFDLYKSIGGPATFLKNLRLYLESVDFPYSTDEKQAGIIFFPISYDLKFLRRFKKRGGLICQRLDGVYYPEKHGPEYVKRNRKILEIYSKLADKVVFQSEYSRRQCFSMLGPLEESSYTIITNGVDTDVFYPNLQRCWDEEHIHFCTTGNFRNADMLVPVIEALDQLQETYTFSFHVIGPIKDDKCAEAVKRDYVVLHGSKTMLQIAEALRSADIFIYSHLNPPCPNSVLEAIASGLPVVGFKSGAMAELLPYSIELLAEVNDNTFHQYTDLRPEVLTEKLKTCILNFSSYREVSLNSCKDYSMKNCGQRYAVVLEELIASYQH